MLASVLQIYSVMLNTWQSQVKAFAGVIVSLIFFLSSSLCFEGVLYAKREDVSASEPGLNHQCSSVLKELAQRLAESFRRQDRVDYPHFSWEKIDAETRSRSRVFNFSAHNYRTVWRQYLADDSPLQEFMDQTIEYLQSSHIDRCVIRLQTGAERRLARGEKIVYPRSYQACKEANVLNPGTFNLDSPNLRNEWAANSAFRRYGLKAKDYFKWSSRIKSAAIRVALEGNLRIVKIKNIREKKQRALEQRWKENLEFGLKYLNDREAISDGEPLPQGPISDDVARETLDFFRSFDVGDWAYFEEIPLVSSSHATKDRISKQWKARSWNIENYSDRWRRFFDSSPADQEFMDDVIGYLELDSDERLIFRLNRGLLAQLSRSDVIRIPRRNTLIPDAEKVRNPRETSLEGSPAQRLQSLGISITYRNALEDELVPTILKDAIHWSEDLTESEREKIREIYRNSQSEGLARGIRQ